MLTTKRKILPKLLLFISGKWCLSNLLETVELISHYLDNGNEVDLLYLDFCKAFDSVPHSRLLIKLQSFGITANTLAIIENFLTNRWMAVRVGDSMARWRPVLSGGATRLGDWSPTICTLYKRLA